jgi:hypothetical protein
MFVERSHTSFDTKMIEEQYSKKQSESYDSFITKIKNVLHTDLSIQQIIICLEFCDTGDIKILIEPWYNCDEETRRTKSYICEPYMFGYYFNSTNFINIVEGLKQYFDMDFIANLDYFR